MDPWAIGDVGQRTGFRYAGKGCVWGTTHYGGGATSQSRLHPCPRLSPDHTPTGVERIKEKEKTRYNRCHNAARLTLESAPRASGRSHACSPPTPRAQVLTDSLTSVNITINRHADTIALPPLALIGFLILYCVSLLHDCGLTITTPYFSCVSVFCGVCVCVCVCVCACLRVCVYSVRQSV